MSQWFSDWYSGTPKEVLEAMGTRAWEDLPTHVYSSRAFLIDERCGLSTDYQCLEVPVSVSTQTKLWQQADRKLLGVTPFPAQ